LPWRQGQETADRARSARNSDIFDCHKTFLTCHTVSTQTDEFSLRAASRLCMH
jgi:hypothetical protein